MTEQRITELQKSLALDRRIASGEIPFLDAIEQLVALGVPRGEAGRRVGILTGRLRDESLPDPKALPDGTGL